MKIAVYSGSFDPIHIGHTMVASFIAQYADVDEVWLLVSPLNPLKAPGPQPTSATMRLKMAAIATEGVDFIRVSGFELTLPVPSYSYQTLRALAEKFPLHEFKLVVGSDNILLFDRWRNYREILDEFGVIVYPRPGYAVTTEQLPNGATLLAGAPTADLSSSFIRKGIADGRDMRFFLPPRVADFIERHHLYTTR